jgi:hypothetical protein
MMTHIKTTMQSFSGYGMLLRRTTTYCFIGAGVLFGCYMYVVGAITFSVIERKGLEESTRTLLSDISMQELQYLGQEKGLTKDVAYSSGLVDAPSLAFTSQKRAVAWNWDAGR